MQAFSWKEFGVLARLISELRNF